MNERTRLLLDGDWTLADLDFLGRSLNINYAYLFWITTHEDNIPQHIRTAFARDLWSREYINETFPHYLLSRIPFEDQARIVSIKYSSPGWIEMAAGVSAFTALALCVRAWLTTADRTIDTLQKIIHFLKQYGIIGQAKQISLDDRTKYAVSEAELLFKEAAPVFGFSPKDATRILELTGNPISALRLMTAMAKSSERLADLQRVGKLRIPKA